MAGRWADAVKQCARRARPSAGFSVEAGSRESVTRSICPAVQHKPPPPCGCSSVPPRSAHPFVNTERLDDAPKAGASMHGGAFHSAPAARVQGYIPRRIVCLGHAIGGGLATLAAAWAALTVPTADVRCISFGAPRVGNSNFALDFINTVGLTYRVVFGADPTPHHPRPLLYSHVSHPIWFEGSDMKFSVRARCGVLVGTRFCVTAAAAALLSSSRCADGKREEARRSCGRAEATRAPASPLCMASRRWHEGASSAARGEHRRR